jgi:hypothetical protein
VPLMPLTRIACTTFAVAAMAGGQESWRFMVTETSDAESAGSPKTSASRPAQSRASAEARRHEVFLLPDVAAIRGEDESHADITWTIYDLTADRVRVYPSKGGAALADHAIHGLVATRAQELRNRSALGGILENAGVDAKDSPLKVLESESELGVETPGRLRKINRKTDGDVVVYEADGQVLARVLFESRPLPSPAPKTFNGFLAHRSALHPAVRRAVVAESRFPRRIETMRQPLGGTTRTTVLVLDGFAKIAAPKLPMEPKGPRSDAHTLKLMTEILGAAPKGKRMPPADLLAAAEKASKGKRHLDAILMVIEVNLIDDRKASGEKLKEYLEAGAGDPQVQSYIQALRAQSPAETRRILATISRSGLTRGHVIDINEAATHHSERQAAKGIAAYEKVLKEQPWITGPWKDLGDLHAAAYSPRAWQCYDVARAICPTHWMLESVKAHEKKLAEDFPDFF